MMTIAVFIAEAVCCGFVAFCVTAGGYLGIRFSIAMFPLPLEVRVSIPKIEIQRRKTASKQEAPQ